VPRRRLAKHWYPAQNLLVLEIILCREVIPLTPPLQGLGVALKKVASII
jgi:hypothetical protein